MKQYRMVRAVGGEPGVPLDEPDAGNKWLSRTVCCAQLIIINNQSIL